MEPQQTYLLTIKGCEGLYTPMQFRVIEVGEVFHNTYLFRPFDNPNQIMTVNREQIAGMIKWEDVKQEPLKVNKI